MIFEFLSPERIEPRGWLKKQLETQAKGLHGNLDKVWNDVKDSKWLGGAHDGWERFPYFLDGFIPLAYLLRDEEMISRAKKYVDALLKDQAENGCFYPVGEEKQCGDIWYLFLIAKVLVVYAECSGEKEKIEKSLARLIGYLDLSFNHNPPFNWAGARWYECIVAAYWLYSRTKDKKLVRFVRRLKTLGMNFGAAISLWDDVKNDWAYETHVVNIAMALKSEALYCAMTGEKYSDSASEMLKKLFEKHGTAYRHFTGDECLSGTSPVQGSELCGIVEAMYSYEWLTLLTGESKWGDFLEALAFNALPAAVSADMWAHQYDQQVNQIACTRFEKQTFRTNNNEANVFGLEPNFGCCTANFGQGFPKFMLSAYLEKEDGIAVVSPVGARIKLKEGGTLVCESEYPFRRTVKLSATEEVKIYYRLPAWGKTEFSVTTEIKDGWAEFTIPKGGFVTATYFAEPVLRERFDGRKCVEYGALLFALPVEYREERREYVREGVERKYPYCDYLYLPTGEWRYAFADDKFTAEERPYEMPFDRKNPPIVVKGVFAPVEWEYQSGHDLAPSPNAGTKRTGQNVSGEMFPYGATYLRMTEMALIKNNKEENI